MLTLVLLETSLLIFSLIDENQTDFNDLGKLLIGGVAAAVVLAVGFTLIRLRLREKSPRPSHFISIGSTHKDNEHR